MENLNVSTCGNTGKDNSTTILGGTPDHNNALLYIVTVLLFYACSIVVLMIKYIRRERVEAEYDNYYYEYVSRDKFQEPRFQNLQNVCHMMKSLTSRTNCVAGKPGGGEMCSQVLMAEAVNAMETKLENTEGVEVNDKLILEIKMDDKTDCLKLESEAEVKLLKSESKIKSEKSPKRKIPRLKALIEEKENISMEPMKIDAIDSKTVIVHAEQTKTDSDTKFETKYDLKDTELKDNSDDEKQCV